MNNSNLHASAASLRSSIDVTRLVSDLGPSVTASAAAFRGLIQQLPSQSLDEQMIGSLIGFFAKTASGRGEFNQGVYPPHVRFLII